jgi:CheY-like chemotaxis protein
VVIEVARELAEHLPRVPGVESEIREALTNLVFNAVDAMPDGGRLTLGTRVAGHSVELDVADTGTGMDEQTRRKCLEPFFTTKGARHRARARDGLRRRQAARGRHHIESAPGRGTRFRITLPITQQSEIATPDAVPADSAVPLRILIIDDDALVLTPLKDILEADGHAVCTADDPRRGIEVFRDAHPGNPFRVVITDLGMPHLDGRAVAKAIKQTSPTTPVILLGKPPKLRELRAALAKYR